jgi:NADH:ubiquinone oxidoreductase subunit D
VDNGDGIAIGWLGHPVFRVPTLTSFLLPIKKKLNDFEYKFLGKKPSPNFELSKQELYVRVEAPKGELGIYLVGDDSLSPRDGKFVHPVLLIYKLFLG